MRRLVAGLLLLCGAAAPAAAAEARAKPRIDALEARRAEGRLTVSFRVEYGLAPEMLERIRSGLPLIQRHRVELLARRAVPLWPSKVHARMHIETSALYDTLTERYALTRTVRIGPRKKRDSKISEETRTTDSLDEVRAWMTEFDALPALELPTTDPDTRLRVRVESTLGRRFVWYMFPARRMVSAEQRLEP